MTQNPGISEWLEEAGWLRGMAASLVGDGAQADDLVQDTWLASLRRPPVDTASPRPWLARVVRNLAHNRRRDEGRRSTREELAREERTVAGPADLAQQAEAQRLVAEAVTRLAEPLRDVIVLRYFQGLDSSAAAAHLGVPAATVRTRLARALEALRVDLDRSSPGGRRTWALLLAPFARRAGTGAGVGSAALVGGASPVLLSVLGVAVAGIAVFDVVRAVSSGPHEKLASDAEPSAGALVVTNAIPGVPASGPREPLVDSSAPSAERQGASRSQSVVERLAPRLVELSGTIRVDGRTPEWPLEITLEPNVPVIPPGDTAPRMRVKREDSVLLPEQGGRFSFSVPEGWSGRLEVRDFPFANGDSALVLAEPTTGLELELVSRAAIFGTLVPTSGDPEGIQGWARLRVGAAWKTTFEVEPSSAARMLQYEETLPFVCCADGRFRIPLKSISEWAEIVLEVHDEARGALQEAVESFVPVDGYELGTFLLEPARDLELTVRDTLGAPIEGAGAILEPVVTSQPSERSNADGILRLRVPERRGELRVTALGYIDRLLPVTTEETELVLEPLSMLELRVHAQLALPEARVELSSDRPLFLWDEDGGWDTRAHAQAAIGGVLPNLRGRPNEGSGTWSYGFRGQQGGVFHFSGLVAGQAFEIEVKDAAGQVLASARTSVGRGEHAELDLGDAGEQPAEHEALPKRRSPKTER
jgi:RNA polymerase sigma-70 factor (ECF subfamily)